MKWMGKRCRKREWGEEEEEEEQEEKQENKIRSEKGRKILASVVPLIRIYVVRSKILITSK